MAVKRAKWPRRLNISQSHSYTRVVCPIFFGISNCHDATFEMSCISIVGGKTPIVVQRGGIIPRRRETDSKPGLNDAESIPI